MVNDGEKKIKAGKVLIKIPRKSAKTGIYHRVVYQE